ncbi:DNA repair protein SWI5 homolog [Ranitomeya variabilis]|uniref:DNA repair protein SWI5 homolog n=1 Tax=Ranitomeya variabilis TaxID=490064 RepID=UPI0040567332
MRTGAKSPEKMNSFHYSTGKQKRIVDKSQLTEVSIPQDPPVYQEHHTRPHSGDALTQFSGVEERGCTVESPCGPGAPRRGTPTQIPRPGSSLRRTPLGIRGRSHGGFKSPVQSPGVSKSPAAHEEDLQREIADLKHKESSLDEEIRKLETEGFCIEELDEHISLLHEYNELKDTGQMLLGRLAAVRGVTTKDLYAEFGLDLDD